MRVDMVLRSVLGTSDGAHYPEFWSAIEAPGSTCVEPLAEVSAILRTLGTDGRGSSKVSDVSIQIKKAWPSIQKEIRMAYFVWDSALETGYETLDSQHKRLFDLANGIELAIEQHPEDNEAAANAVYGLIDYVLEHFQNEEAIMAECQYPDAERHKALHVQLGVETMTIAARCMSGETLMPLELAAFVRNWLYDHIRVQDMRLVAFIHVTAAERQPVAV